MIDVEVWGGRPNSGSDEEYRKTRRAKEIFNVESNRFLGIERSEGHLTELALQLTDLGAIGVRLTSTGERILSDTP